MDIIKTLVEVIVSFFFPYSLPHHDPRFALIPALVFIFWIIARWKQSTRYKKVNRAKKWAAAACAGWLVYLVLGLLFSSSRGGGLESSVAGLAYIVFVLPCALILNVLSVGCIVTIFKAELAIENKTDPWLDRDESVETNGDQ